MAPPRSTSIKSPLADIPPSSNTCELFLIDTTTDILVESAALIEPEIKGHEFLNLPTFAFYIHNARLDQRVLFDMGSRKDWWNLPPSVVSSFEGKGVPGIRVTKNIDEILSAGGIDPGSINAAIWSHYHWDHIGDIQRFPTSTEVVTGSGFRESFLPGYPTNKASPILDRDFEGRALREIHFEGDGSLRIGQLLAYDFFGDQSFYLLNTPGHTASHICGLVRTTPETFVFLGGDIGHFPGTYRPTHLAPMPEVIPPETKLDSRIPQPCPCSMFTACHPAGLMEGRKQPFYNPSTQEKSWYDDVEEAKRSIEGMAEFDADDNVFVAIAHDPALREVCSQFPHTSMTAWKSKGWKKQFHWHFLNELPLDGKPGRPKLVETRTRN